MRMLWFCLGQSEAVFRFETANPLKEPKQLDSVIDKLLSHIRKLQPSKEEVKTLSQLSSQTVVEETPEPEPEKSDEEEA